MAPMSLPPGFRFHPTDEELITYYLDRKITGRKIDLEIIPQVDLYKCEPWDLPDKSYLPSKDMEWYFYSQRDRKYPNGSRTNRATRAGYWKATGKDRSVQSRKRPVGMKKTLVYYRGRAPHGIRTNWVMHEYRLIEDSTYGNAPSALKDSFALCRVFKKTTQIPRIREEGTIDNDSENVENETAWFSDENMLIDDNGSNNEVDHIIEAKYEDLKRFSGDTSSSDITQGTCIDTATPGGDDLRVKFAAMSDEANSSTNQNLFFSNVDCPSSFFQDFEMPATTCSRNLNYSSYQVPPLAIEDFPAINIKDTTKQLGTVHHQLDSFDEYYMNFDDHKDHIYTTSGSTTMLDEIMSLCSTSKDTCIDLSSFHDFS